VSLLAQATDGALDATTAVSGLATKLDTPKVDWIAISPAVVLISAALLLLVIASLAKHTKWVRGFSTWFTIGSALTAGVFTFPLWDRVNDGRPTSALVNALHIDGFSVFFTVVAVGAVVLAALVLDGYLLREGLEGPEVFVLLLLSASGGVVMASANDLIVLFLGLEILSISLYVLAGSHLRRAESQEAALKYFVLGGFSSAVFLYGIALTYGATGSTNLTEIASYLANNIVFGNGLLLGGLSLMLVGLGFKVAAVPFHVWTPDVYQGSPSPVTGFMAAAAKAAGFSALLRVMLTGLATHRVDWQPIVWVLSIASMLLGAVLAVVQTDVKRMLAYSSISHAGFILIGLQAANASGLSSALVYLFAYAIIVLGTFAVITVVGGRGDAAHSLDDYNGLAKRSPFLAVALTVFLLAQAGIPATSGFISKFGVIRAAADAHSYAIAIIAMLVSVIGAFFYLRVILRMWAGGDDHDGADGAHGDVAVAQIRMPIATQVAIAIAFALTIAIGIAPQMLIDFADRALLR
jgi:NADH-quinone oxidoreductase subunit N